MSLNTTRKRCTGFASPAFGSIVLICTHCNTGWSTGAPLVSKMFLLAVKMSSGKMTSDLPDSSLRDRLLCHDGFGIRCCGGCAMVAGIQSLVDACEGPWTRWTRPSREALPPRTNRFQMSRLKVGWRPAYVSVWTLSPTIHSSTPPFIPL